MCRINRCPFRSLRALAARVRRPPRFLSARRPPRPPRGGSGSITRRGRRNRTPARRRPRRPSGSASPSPRPPRSPVSGACSPPPRPPRQRRRRRRRPSPPPGPEPPSRVLSPPPAPGFAAPRLSFLSGSVRAARSAISSFACRRTYASSEVSSEDVSLSPPSPFSPVPPLGFGLGFVPGLVPSRAGAGRTLGVEMSACCARSTNFAPVGAAPTTLLMSKSSAARREPARGVTAGVAPCEAPPAPSLRPPAPPAPAAFPLPAGCIAGAGWPRRWCRAKTRRCSVSICS